MTECDWISTNYQPLSEGDIGEIPVVFVTVYTDKAPLSYANAINTNGVLRKPSDDDYQRIALDLGEKMGSGEIC